MSTEQQQNWEFFAKTDPLWSILSGSDKRNNRWDVEAFFATGREEIGALMADLDHRGLTPARRRALDFGCGVGRLSQALAAHFDEVIGVDHSPTMVRKATEYDQTGKCRFIVNTSTDIPDVPSRSINLVYSRIALQHVERDDIEPFLRSLARVIAPGGMLVFQLPTVQSNPIKRFLVRVLPRWVVALRRWIFWRGGPQMLMNGIPRDRVVTLIQGAGLTLIEAKPDHSDDAWLGYLYYFRASD